MTGEPSAPRIGAVVLAAGASTRLGRPKQLVEYAGEPLVRRAARSAAEAGAAPVLVVVGAHAAQVAPALDGLAGVRTLHNADWASGLASSLAVGLRVLLEDSSLDAALVTLADQPLVDAVALRRLIAAFTATRRIVAAAYGDGYGVPVVVAREHLDALARLEGDRGAGAWLRTRPELVTPVPLDAAAVDVDTHADLARLGDSSHPA